MTDSEEVEKVLQSLASDLTISDAAESADPDSDKVEELLRQIEQEKIHGEGGDDVAEQVTEKPKPSRSPAKKPNGVKVGDKPAAPAKKVSLSMIIPSRK